MEKKNIAASFLFASLIFVGAGCSSTAPETAPQPPAKEAAAQQQPTPEPTTDVNTSVTILPEKPKSGAPEQPANATVKTFKISAKNWSWNPNKITVKKGDKVHLVITGADAEHGFAIREYNINVKFKPGETKTVDFVADKAGSFTFYCSVPCGSGHRDMKGTLIVK